MKGEIFDATFRHRLVEGDAVYRFSPFDFERPNHRYNPPERVARIVNPEQHYTELAKISDYFLTVSDKGTAGDFLAEGRELFVAAGLLAIERGKPTIGEVSIPDPSPEASAGVCALLTKGDSRRRLIVIQAVICDGDQLGTRPDVGRRVGVL